MSFTDTNADGAALASLELHRGLITLLVRYGLVPKRAALEVVDEAQQRLAKMQMGAEQLNWLQRGTHPPLQEQAEAARRHLEVVFRMLSDLPEPHVTD
ncbi:hypothetical protein [Methylobacterium nigriterrae]|uniref:hypothetical protein n=1 Tax=Methylobacterium nigriterrae TaxID=3127512 RepID=UPI0030133C60